MKDCIIVTSIVEISDKPLSFTSIRSVYTYQQRFEQTLETIESIRKHLPNTDIILAECSPDSDYMKELEKRVDMFINTYPNDLILNGRHKGICEAQLMLYVFDRVDLSQYQNIFKMTGRYKLTDRFDRSLWLNDYPVACKSFRYGSEGSMHTFFYKFTNRELVIVTNTFEAMISNNTTDPIEYIMYSILNSKLTNIHEIGIEVRWSCYNQIEHA
jgi:hypothetical protein